jgi:hypothetical protein
LANAANQANRNRVRIEQENRTLRANAAAREREIARRHEEEVSSLQDNIRQMQGRQDEEVRRLHTNFQDQIIAQADDFSRQIAEQDEARRQNEDELSRRIDAQGNQIRGELRNLQTSVGQQFGRININMQAINNRVSAIASDFGGRFDELARREADQEGRARMIEDELSAVVGTIRSLKPEKFTPGDFAPIAEMYEQTRNNIQNGDFQAAIATGQQCVVDASGLASRLAFLNAIFNERLSEVRNAASRLRERIDAFVGAALPGTFELNGQKYTVAYDINYWSRDAFAAIRERFDGLDGSLDGAEGNVDMDIAALDIVMDALGRVDADITDCNELALRALAGAQLTAETAQAIENALATQGWTLDADGHYSGDEKEPLCRENVRDPFCMQYEDGMGNRVSIVVNADDPDSAEFNIDVYPVQEDAEDFKQTMRSELYDVLRASSDIEIPSVAQQNDCQENPTPEAFIRNRAQSLIAERRRAFEPLKQPAPAQTALGQQVSH